ncbi:dihydrodipicolinate synthase family protein [Saccharothrix longispora]|uniref:dihydrodipicolinate synthase family protein n=1 Tax=Saccharothrix longispora TaxID=33920 RepID=UPI0028FD1897|nr:dihydrodipicolinate synthase family protein [Saccharothrix longispora]MBY8851076.1 dihydrodipicolinate synthase family protein [Saccharothrix sp. MB29]MDU0289050.1 dihydrodipicolinate synthase family protein [Saccharothrix longispora]
MTLSGVHVPLITPFDADGRVALDALRRLADDVLDEGAAGLVALGTTGEPGSLTEAERRAVVDLVADVCRERGVPLTVGASTAEALAALDPSEVTAALATVPPFVRPGEAGVVAHFAHLAALSPVPLIVYNIPYRTGQHLSVGALRDLAAVPGVAGVKHAVGGIDADTVALLADPPADFAVLGGDDLVISPLLAMGAHGGILASANVVTAGFADLVDAWRTDPARARALANALAPLSDALFAAPNPTVVKGVLHALGRIPTPAVRLPLLPAAPEAVRAALAALDRLPVPVAG